MAAAIRTWPSLGMDLMGSGYKAGLSLLISIANSPPMSSMVLLIVDDRFQQQLSTKVQQTRKFWDLCVNFWKDFRGQHEWRFPEVPPSQLQKLAGCLSSNPAERARAEWMWRRRPTTPLNRGYFGYRVLLAISALFPLVHRIGIALDFLWVGICYLLIALDGVRTIRWRRDYEASLLRLTRSWERREPFQ